MHMKFFLQSLKEQEKTVSDNTTLVEKSIAEKIKPKSSYTEMVKDSTGWCSEGGHQNECSSRASCPCKALDI